MLLSVVPLFLQLILRKLRPEKPDIVTASGVTRRSLREALPFGSGMHAGCPGMRRGRFLFLSSQSNPTDTATSADAHGGVV
jgi:hypothetical protein